MGFYLRRTYSIKLLAIFKENGPIKRDDYVVFHTKDNFQCPAIVKRANWLLLPNQLIIYYIYKKNPLFSFIPAFIILVHNIFLSIPG